MKERKENESPDPNSENRTGEEIVASREESNGNGKKRGDKKKLSPKKMKKHLKKAEEKLKELESENHALKDKNLRLYAEFDNFRKRSLKERMDFAKSAGQDLIRDLL